MKRATIRSKIGCARTAELVEDHESKTGETFCKLSGFAFSLLLFERVDELDGREEAYLAAMMFDSLHAKGCRDMGFASAGTTDQHDVLGTVHELAAMKLAQRGLTDLTGCEVEAGEVLAGRGVVSRRWCKFEVGVISG